VNFPLLSRLQDDREAFARSIERTIQVCATVTLLFVALFMGLGPAVVQAIFGDKWMPALPTLYVFAAAISVGFLVPIISGALDAMLTLRSKKLRACAKADRDRVRAAQGEADKQIAVASGATESKVVTVSRAVLVSPFDAWR